MPHISRRVTGKGKHRTQMCGCIDATPNNGMLRTATQRASYLRRLVAAADAGR